MLIGGISGFLGEGSTGAVMVIEVLLNANFSAKFIIYLAAGATENGYRRMGMGGPVKARDARCI
jgi:hypothetical protein